VQDQPKQLPDQPKPPATAQSQLNLIIQSQQSVNHCLGLCRRTAESHWTYISSSVALRSVRKSSGLMQSSHGYTDSLTVSHLLLLLLKGVSNYRRSLSLLVT